MSVLTDLIQDPSGTGRHAIYSLVGPATKTGQTDPNGALVEDLPDGEYLYSRTAGGLTNIDVIYVPNLEGPFTIADLLGRRPAAGMVMYGTALHGMDAHTQTPTEHTLATMSPGSWVWPAGFAIGWTDWDERAGLLWMAGQGQKLNAARTTGIDCRLASFDPRTGQLAFYAIPTDRGTTAVIGSTGLTGGAYGADVAVMTFDAETRVFQLHTLPFNLFYPWSIAGNGVYPLLATVLGTGETRTLDTDASVTTQELHDSGATGADAFPLATSPLGESYYDALLASELAVTPVSNVLIVPQYAATNPNHPAGRGGSILAIDPVTQEVLAQWVSPLTGAASQSSETEYAGTVASDSSVGGGTVAWTNPTRAQGVPDDTTADCTLAPAAVSHMLKATNYGFAIPSTATITGIVATATRAASYIGPSSPIVDGHVWLVKAGVVQTGGTDQGTAAAWSAAMTDAPRPAGASDLWGGTWTPADINDSGFGVAWQAKNTGATSSAPVVDAIAITVYYTIPGLGTSDPRAPMMDPTGTLGAETFAVIYDTFDSGGTPAAFNSFQVFTYDHGAGTITPLSDWLITDAASDHWTNGGFDEDGWLYLSRRIRLSTTPTAVFPKADGGWKCTRYPFAYTGTYGTVCTPDFFADTAPRGANFSQVKAIADPETNSMWFLSANLRAQGIRHEGDAHSPRITVLPPVDTALNTYVAPNETGLLAAMKPSIDTTARALMLPVGQIFKNTESYPQAPVVRNQYMGVVDIDRCGAGPQWQSPSVADDRLSKTTWDLTLPSRWQVGDLVMFAFANTLTTDPAVAPLTVSAGWTKMAGSEVRNGAAGLRYVLLYRIMQTGDTVGPTVSWTGSKNLIYIGSNIVGADTTTPIDAFAITLGPAAGSTLAFVTPQVTPSVAGCRIYQVFISQGSQLLTIGEHEITPGTVKRKERAGTTLSACMTEEEQLVSTSPTRARYAEYGTAGLNAVMTIAIRPAATPSAPKAVTSIACVPNPVAHGNTTIATVTLASAADRDTAVVVTASNNKATVPGHCIVLAGATTGTVTVNAITAGTVTLSAYSGSGSTQNTVLTIT